MPETGDLYDKPMQESISRLAIFVLVASPTLSFAQIDLSGTLLQADGNPMAAAHLVIQNGPRDINLVVPVNAAGYFAVTLNEPGGYGLYATGVYHETLQMPLILTDQKQVELHIRLQTNAFALSPDTLYVVSAESDKAVQMQRQQDGTFAVRLDAHADTLAYRIRYGYEPSEWRSDKIAAGTMQDRLIFDDSGPFWDSEGDYFSVVDVTGEPFVDITYDLSALPQHELDPSVTSNPPVTARIAQVYFEVKERGRRIDFTGNFLNFMNAASRERGAVKKQFASEQDPLVRQWYLMRYFDDLQATLWPRHGRRLARKALESIPADSPLWSYEAWSPVGASNLMYRIAQRLKGQELLKAYVRRVIEEHPDSDVRAQFLDHGLYYANSEGDEKTKWLYYSMLQDSYADTRQAERARRDFDQDRQLQAGNPVPQFSFVSFDDPTVTITNVDFQGQVYLLDFWGTWCAPCIKEIPYLEEAYGKYGDSGFEILSVAFLDDPRDIKQFREDSYPMPWLHTRVTQEDDNSIRDLFEITSFPRPILVDEDGIILAIDEELRGGKLLDMVDAAYEGAR
jgi:thiol-disulfide isomerase/thioredoxin